MSKLDDLLKDLYLKGFQKGQEQFMRSEPIFIGGEIIPYKELKLAILEVVRGCVPKKEDRYLTHANLQYQLGWVEGHRDAIDDINSKIGQL